MVLIFEGADLSGKTTIATHYLHSLRVPIVRIRWDLANERVETLAFAKVTIGLLTATRANVILDRSFLSMWAYTREPSDYFDPLVEALRFVPELHVIVLTMGAEELHRRYEKHPDTSFSEERLRSVDRRFSELPARYGRSIDVLHLDTARFSPPECVTKIDAHLGLGSRPIQRGSPVRPRVLEIPIGEIPVGITFPE